MKTVEIVSHCYAAEHQLFAAALGYQLSSLVIHRPKHCNVLVTVCMVNDASDTNTSQMVHGMSQYMVDGLRGQACFLPKEQLWRRAIGRNVVAKMSTADYVWFADADYAFGEGCLDSLVEQFDAAAKDVVMVYPKTVRISVDHATGDRTLAKMSMPQLLDINQAEYVDKHHRFAIGGMQIVRGDFARTYGYLNDNEKFQRPVTTPFPDTNCDMAYRKYCAQYGGIVGIDLPEVYRLRHSVSSYRDKG